MIIWTLDVVNKQAIASASVVDFMALCWTLDVVNKQAIASASVVDFLAL